MAVFANDAPNEQEKKYQEFINMKIKRMKQKSKQLEVRKESEDDCQERQRIYEEKQKLLLENFALKSKQALSDSDERSQFNCQDEQKLEQPSHAVSYDIQDAFLNMRIKWCPELWWRFDGLEECEKK